MPGRYTYTFTIKNQPTIHVGKYMPFPWELPFTMAIHGHPWDGPHRTTDSSGFLMPAARGTKPVSSVGFQQRHDNQSLAARPRGVTRALEIFHRVYRLPLKNGWLEGRKTDPFAFPLLGVGR